MTDFMTALPVFLVQPTCPRDQRASVEVRNAREQLVRNDRRCVNLGDPRAPTGDILAAVLEPKASSSRRSVTFAERATKLSLLSTPTCAAPPTGPVHHCLDPLKSAIEKSDAMLYAPSANDVHANCKMMSLRCYMLELIMVINEEDIKDKKVNCIHRFNARLPKDNSAGCPPCEAYPLENSRVFLERLKSLLQEIQDTAENTQNVI